MRKLNIAQNFKKLMYSVMNLFQSANKMKVYGITDILFKYGLMVICAGIIAAFFTPPLVYSLIIALGIIFMIVGMIFYAYFAIKKPEYLRTEEYQLKHTILQTIGDKENPNAKELIQLVTPDSTGLLNRKNEE